MLNTFRRSVRILKITYIILKYGLDRVLFRLPLLQLFKWLCWFNPFYWQIQCQHLSTGERLRLALEELGPIFVKFGQILSTRRDVIPEEIVEALTKLQDQVKSFDPAMAVRIVETALGRPIESVFSRFDEEALASASIAQVHAAELKTGQEVIVKVLRPNIKEQIAQDIAILRRLAKILEALHHAARRIHVVGIVDELARTLDNELDLLKEAANASQLRRQFQDSAILSIPKIYWEWTHTKVLVMDRVYGISVNDKNALLAAQFSLKEVAKTGIEAFYTQVFRNAFFHADMHPGNVFIAPHSQKKPCWILIDFGIVGTLSKENQHYLAANFLAFIDRNYRRVAELHLESAWVPPNVRVDVLESAIRSVCEPMFELPQNQISLGQTLLRLIKIAREFKMEVMPELLLLQKTLVNIEGVAKQLDPDINMWIVARPILEKWMKEQIGWRHFWKRFKEQLPTITERLPEIPELVYQILKGPAYAATERKFIHDKNPIFARKTFWLGAFFGFAVSGFFLLHFFLIRG